MFFFKKCYLVVFCTALLCANIGECRSKIPKKKDKDVEALKDLVTIITTTHPVPGIPSTALLEKTQKSLFLVPAMQACRKIIVFDGINPNLGYFARRLTPEELAGRDIQSLVKERYNEYKNNVAQLAKTNPYFSNTELVFCQEHLNLAFAIKEALQHVTTPFVFIHQHDLEIIKYVDAINVIHSMQCNPNIKLVRLNTWGNEVNEWDSLLDNYVEGGCTAPLLRTNLWSDQDHFCSVAYYTDFILPKLPPNSCMEWFLMQEEKKEIAKDIANHLKYGTYLYGRRGEGSYLRHWDGSRSYGTRWEY